MRKPLQGEVWFIDLNPTRGREQAKKRPCVILSNNIFNQGPSGLVIIAPLTSKDKGNPLHIPVRPPEGGLVVRSFVMVEQIRCVSQERLQDSCLGSVSFVLLKLIKNRLDILIDRIDSV